MKVRRPTNNKAAHKHMDNMLSKYMGNRQAVARDVLALARWSLTARLTPCERWMVGIYIMNWG